MVPNAIGITEQGSICSNFINTLLFRSLAQGGFCDQHHLSFASLIIKHQCIRSAIILTFATLHAHVRYVLLSTICNTCFLSMMYFK